MKKMLVVLLAAATATLGLSGMALAFHDGGVAGCEGCHTMHNSQGGAIIAPSGTIANGPSKFLTVGSDPSSTCLSCHFGSPGGYHIMTATGETLSPGGDFYWLKAETHYTGAHGYNSLPDSHGHNVIAADFTLTQDAILGTGPSDGTKAYAAADLGCNSCHDPHGKVGTTGTNNANRENAITIASSGSKNAELQNAAGGTSGGNYVLLGDQGYDGGQTATWGATFAARAPIAQSNRKSLVTDHSDYASGMSEWCANCHTGFAQSTNNVTGGDLTGLGGGTAHTHPAGAGALMGGGNVSVFYNKYAATGEIGTVNNTNSYDILVPFERAVAGAAGLDTASTSGPVANDQVMCLSCHRAHASGFSDIGRWDFEEALLADSPIFDATDGLGTAKGELAYYNRFNLTDGGAYNLEQRSLCNKCHLQD